MSKKIAVGIATARRDGSICNVLEQLAKCEKPGRFTGVYVVENGTGGVLREQIESFSEKLKLNYVYCDLGNKSEALNRLLELIDDDALLVMLDDDVVIENDLLIRYAEAADNKPGEGHVFGGGIRIIGDLKQVPEHKRNYLPPSMRGWNEAEMKLGTEPEFVVGFNWAAYVRDMKRAGGFDKRFGPGSNCGATGQETMMQRSLKRRGCGIHLIPNAEVGHHVPDENYENDYVFHRNYRKGISWGLAEALDSKGRVSQFAAILISSVRAIVRVPVFWGLKMIGLILRNEQIVLYNGVRAALWRGYLVGYLRSISANQCDPQEQNSK